MTREESLRAMERTRGYTLAPVLGVAGIAVMLAGAFAANLWVYFLGMATWGAAYHWWRALKKKYRLT